MIHTLQTTRVPQKTTISDEQSFYQRSADYLMVVMQKVMSWFYFYQSVCRSNRRSVRCSIHRYIAPFHFWRVKCCCWTLICHPTVGDLFTHYILLYTFLDAFSHLYKRVCLSVHQYVRRSVSPSVRPSVGHKRVEIIKKCLFWAKLRYVRVWNVKVRQFNLNLSSNSTKQWVKKIRSKS